MTAATIEDTNMPEPKVLAAAKQKPLLDESLPEAENEKKTSGAPFPKARRVTPFCG